MIIKAPALSAHLQKTLAPLYFIYGQEPLLVLEASDQIKKQAQQRGFSERNSFFLDQHFDWQELSLHQRNQSLFSNQQILECSIGQESVSATLTQGIKQLCEQLNPNQCVILTFCYRLDKAQTQASWYRTVANKGVIIPIWPLTGAAFQQWLNQQIQNFKLTLSAMEKQQLSSYTMGNCLAAKQILEKLQLFPQAKLTDFIEDMAHFDVFNLCEQVTAGATQNAIRILHRLQQTGAELPIILWALLRELREKIAARLSFMQVQQLLSFANTIDDYIKTNDPLSWITLEQWLILATSKK